MGFLFFIYNFYVESFCNTYFYLLLFQLEISITRTPNHESPILG